jgi:streptogramin lyase
MKLERDLRERLQAEAARMPDPGPAPVGGIVRSGRRRRVVRVTATGLAVVVLCGALAWSLLSMGGLGPGARVRPAERGVPVEDAVTTWAAPDFPGDLAVGDGSLWAADAGGTGVFRFDPETGDLQTTVPFTVSAGAPLAYGLDALWVAPNSGRPGIVRVDPSTNRAEDVPVGAVIADVEVGLGSVWALSRAGAVLQLDAEGAEVSRWTLDPSVAGDAFLDLAVGDEGVWVGGGEVSSVYRIDPTVPSEPTAWTIPPPPGYSSTIIGSIEVGGGWVWVNAAQLARFRPDDPTAVEWTAFPGAAMDISIEYGEGHLWVACFCPGAAPGRFGSLFRVGPSNPEFEGPLPVSPPGGAVATGLGWVWVAGSGNDSTLERIDPDVALEPAPEPANDRPIGEILAMALAVAGIAAVLLIRRADRRRMVGGSGP